MSYAVICELGARKLDASFSIVHILGSQNLYSKAEGIADLYWPWTVFKLLRWPSQLLLNPSHLPLKPSQ